VKFLQAHTREQEVLVWRERACASGQSLSDFVRSRLNRTSGELGRSEGTLDQAAVPHLATNR
jgi:hypothetical protein